MADWPEASTDEGFQWLRNKAATSQMVLKQRSKFVTTFLMSRAVLTMPVSSAIEARPRDRAAKFGRCRLRCQFGALTRVGPAAFGTAKRRAEQPCVELIWRCSTTPAALFFKQHTVTGAATCTSALMHHAVIRQRHAGCEDAKSIVHLLTTIGPAQAILQRLPGIREGPGQH